MKRRKKRTASKKDWINGLMLLLDTVQAIFNHTTDFLDRSWRFTYSLFKKNPSWKNRYYAMTTILMTASMTLVGLAEYRNWELNRVIDMYPLRSVATVQAFEKEVEVFKNPETPEEIIRSVFGKDAELALRVAKCESGLNPKAKNKVSSARGLFQIMQSWHKIDEKWLFDPMINTLVAKNLFDASGGSFSPHWEASSHCWN